jgi:hypothetical protein
LEKFSELISLALAETCACALAVSVATKRGKWHLTRMLQTRFVYLNIGKNDFMQQGFLALLMVVKGKYTIRKTCPPRGEKKE